MKRVLMAGVLALGSTGLMADNFSYNQLQAMVNNTEWRAAVDGTSGKIDDTGYGISGSVRLPRNFYLAGSYDRAKIEGARFTGYTVGLGAFVSVAEGVDLFAELAHVKEKIRVFGASEDDNGGALTLGARGLWTPNFEAEARYRYTDMGGDWDPYNSIYLSGMYRVTEQLGVGINYRRDSLDQADIDLRRTVVGAFVRATF